MHSVDTGQHPIAMLTQSAADGWDPVIVSVYGNLRIYTVRRSV